MNANEKRNVEIVTSGINEAKLRILDAMDVLLAGSALLTEDLIKAVEDERSCWDEEEVRENATKPHTGFLGTVVEKDQGAGEAAAEVDAEAITLGEEVKSQCINELKARFAQFTVAFQRDILERYMAEVLPALEVQQEEEAAWDNAMQEFYDLVNPLSAASLRDFVEEIKERAVVVAA